MSSLGSGMKDLGVEASHVTLGILVKVAGGWKGAETAVVFPPSIFLVGTAYIWVLNIHVIFFFGSFILLMEEVRQSTTCNV